MTLHPHPDLRIKPPLEKDVQRRIITLFRHAGLQVDSTSQARASMIARGLPDLLVFGPGVFFFFEVKSYRPAGYRLMDRTTWRPLPLRPDQEAFRDKCLKAGVRHFWGGYVEAEDALVALGLGQRTASGLFTYHRHRSAA